MFVPLSSLLSGTTRRYGIETEVSAHQVLAAVTGLLPSLGVLDARATRFAHGLVTIEVLHPAAAANLKLAEAELHRAIQDARLPRVVRGFRFMAGQ